MEKVVTRNSFLFILLIFILCRFGVAATTIYVDVSNTSGIEDGSLEHPFNTIMEGIGAAYSGDTVQVAAGTYWENVVMKAGVDLIGAGASTVTINAGGSGTVIEGAEGCTISGFFITGSGSDHSCNGIKCFSCSMLITENAIYGCTNGIYCSSSSSTISKNVISNNGNSGNGTVDFAICCNNSSLYICNNLIMHNLEVGIYTCSSGSDTAVIVNNTIVDNSNDCGIWCYESSPTIRNDIIVGNYSGIVATHSSFPVISYNDVWNNTWENYNAQSGSICEPGTGDISADPFFVDPGCYDYHIGNYSLCIGAGIWTCGVPSTDIEGNPRPNPTGSNPDMGAFENSLGGIIHDLLGTWDGQGVYYKDSDTGTWVKIATPADLIAAGDLDGDGIDDLIGIWAGQGGVWVKYSSTGSWSKLSSTARDIASGDMNGDGKDDLLGTWDGQGVYYRDSDTGTWVKIATPADLIAAGDLDGDGIDDLIGIWAGQGGVWVKYSSTGSWSKLSSTARDIASGDMNGDGKDDLLGTWDGQGVYYKDSDTGTWVKMASPADLIVAGDLDGDGKDDLIGIWAGQGGVWVKYSSTGSWSKLSSTARDIDAGKMSGGSGGGGVKGFMILPAPIGGYAAGPGSIENYLDISSEGPGGWNFVFQAEENLVPKEKESMRIMKTPGPGEAGFVYVEQKNLFPQEESIRKRKENKDKPKQRKKN